jgi:LPS export ABC transporter protein LptC
MPYRQTHDFTMLKDKRNFLWLVPLAAVLALPLWKPLVADYLNPVRQTGQFQSPSLTKNSALNSSTMTGVEFEQSLNGAKEWLINASRLSSSGSDDNLQFQDVRALFFSSNGNHEKTSISSKRASYNSVSMRLILAGLVLIKNEAGYEMRTDSLEYLAAEKKIQTASAVTIQGSNIAVSGNRLTYDTVTGDFTLAGKVKCRIW